MFIQIPLYGDQQGLKVHVSLSPYSPQFLLHTKMPWMIMAEFIITATTTTVHRVQVQPLANFATVNAKLDLENARANFMVVSLARFRGDSSGVDSSVTRYPRRYISVCNPTEVMRNTHEVISRKSSHQSFPARVLRQ